MGIGDIYKEPIDDIRHELEKPDSAITPEHAMNLANKYRAEFHHLIAFAAEDEEELKSEIEKVEAAYKTLEDIVEKLKVA